MGLACEPHLARSDGHDDYEGGRQRGTRIRIVPWWRSRLSELGASEGGTVEGNTPRIGKLTYTISGETMTGSNDTSDLSLTKLK